MENNTSEQLSVFLESNKYSVIEASKLDIPVVIVNLGEKGDNFELSVVGVPQGWISLPSSTVIFLERGESKRIFIRVSPPPSVASIAGEYLLHLQIASQTNPHVRQQKQITLLVADSEQEGKLAILFDTTEISATPGSRVEIPFILHNQSETDGFFEIGTAGIPSSWLENPPSVVQVPAGARKNLTLVLNLPPAPYIKAGSNNFTVFARNQANPSQTVETGLNLVVAAFRVAGRIGLLMGAVQFSCTPGKGVEVPITLLNQGLEEDTLSISLEGIPRNWASMPSSSMRLRPGEQRDLVITIRPPRAPESRAGRHVFKVKVASALARNTPVESECVLSMATFVDFNIELDKHQLQAGENARLVVKNQGNVQQSFLMSWNSPEDSLIPYVYMPVTKGAKTEWKFLPVQQARLNIPAGQEAATTFRLKPSAVPFVGNPDFVPFKTEVVAADKRKLDVSGQVVIQPIIPTWLLGIFGVVVAAMVLMLAVFALSQINFERPPTPTPDFVQTFIAEQTQTAVVNNNMVATISAGLTRTAEVLPLFATNTSAPATPTFAPFTPTYTPTSTPTFTPTITSTPTIPVTPSPTATPVPIFRGELLISSNRENGVNQIYSITGSTGQRVARLTSSPAFDERPAWSPDGKRIAFSTNRDGNWEIYVMDANGSNLRNLTSNAAADQYPTWSPDNQWIAFTSNRDGNLEIYKINADGTGLINLTNSASDDQMPAWGVVGGLFDKRAVIAFVSNRNGNDEIYLMTPDGLNLVNITNNVARDYAPAISIDGWIAFTSNRSSNEDIFVMAPDGSNITNLTNHPAKDTFPAFSGDGTELAFTTDRDGNQEIYIVTKDGKLTYNLTKNAYNDQFPAWR